MSRSAPDHVATQPDHSSRADARRNRETVLESAIGLLAERPDASMREIAAASGLGRTTVYRHFPTRDDLVLGLCERLVRDGRRRAVALVAGDPPLADVFVRLANDAVDIGDRYRFLQAHRQTKNNVVVDMADAPEIVLVAYFQGAADRGELRPGVTVPWVMGVTTSTLSTMVNEIHAGRMERGSAPDVVGETLRRAFAA